MSIPNFPEEPFYPEDDSPDSSSLIFYSYSPTALAIPNLPRAESVFLKSLANFISRNLHHEYTGTIGLELCIRVEDERIKSGINLGALPISIPHPFCPLT